MAEAKTKPGKASVAAFLAKVAGDERRKDCAALVKMMTAASGAQPVLWGPSIVGFGTYTLRYASGREAEWPVIGFSPRKSALVMYNLAGLPQFAKVRAKLGRHKAGGGCLYVTRLDDVDRALLAGLFDAAVKAKKKKPL
ncbi:MAG: DUF1801 domain-containing protein [Candidatus Eisenbacteria bacterium]|nr:DUF1801 domain-containing protein [Candidatus Eisenbacteria bacterium]